MTILAVSEDDDDNAYKQFVKDHNVDLLTVRDTKRSNELYGTFKFPETFVIDKATARSCASSSAPRNGPARRSWIT